MNLGAIGVTGTPGANIAARDADLVIAIGTRLSDFTTASKTAFQNPDVRFLNINVAEFDAFKHAGLPLIADARAALEQLGAALARLSRSRTTTAACDLRLEGAMGRGDGPHLRLASRSADQPGRSRSAR